MTICKTCGTTMFQSPRSSGFQWCDVIVVRNHRDVEPHPAPGVALEHSPQLTATLTVYASVVRNGGPENPICDGCVRVGLTVLRNKLNELLGK